MILTGPEIKANVQAGKITIEPYTDSLLNPNSYNYRLGQELRIFGETLDANSRPEEKDLIIGEEGYLLLPGCLYLARTMEKMGSTHFVPSLIGRSSVGRLGLWLQVTADLGNLGSSQNWTLELKVVQPLRVYAGMKIGQITFWQPQGDLDMQYKGKYQGDAHLRTSELIKEQGK